MEIIKELEDGSVIAILDESDLLCIDAFKKTWLVVNEIVFDKDDLEEEMAAAEIQKELAEDPEGDPPEDDDDLEDEEDEEEDEPTEKKKRSRGPGRTNGKAIFFKSVEALFAKHQGETLTLAFIRSECEKNDISAGSATAYLPQHPTIKRMARGQYAVVETDDGESAEPISGGNPQPDNPNKKIKYACIHIGCASTTNKQGTFCVECSNLLRAMPSAERSTTGRKWMTR